MHRLRRQTGISFVEVLAAIGLFSIIATGITTSTLSNLKLSTQSRSIAAATALAQNKIEQIRLTQPVTNTTPADLTTGTHTDSGNPLTALDGSSGTYTRSWSVQNVSQYYNGSVVGVRPGIVQVAVTVSWSAPVAGSTTTVTYACTTPLC